MYNRTITSGASPLFQGPHWLVALVTYYYTNDKQRGNRKEYNILLPVLMPIKNIHTHTHIEIFKKISIISAEMPLAWLYVVYRFPEVKDPWTSVISRFAGSWMATFSPGWVVRSIWVSRTTRYRRYRGTSCRIYRCYELWTSAGTG